jgi:hypothetical protein
MRLTGILTALALGMAGTTAIASPVDLSSWIENGNPNDGAGSWTLESGNNAVKQSINGRPTVYHNNQNSQGNALAGTIEVQTYGDDDFVGFVLGYQDGEINSSTADFWLIDWKQGDQAGQTAGLALSHVSGDLTSTYTGTSGPWWQHDAPVNEVQRATNLGTTGWASLVEYAFDLIFTKDLIEVKVEGVTELSFSSTDNGGVQFTDGAFGFYNFSQANVRYAGITEEVLPPTIPVPAAFPLLLTALGGLGFAGWRRKRAGAV